MKKVFWGEIKGAGRGEGLKQGGNVWIRRGGGFLTYPVLGGEFTEGVRHQRLW